MLTEGRAVFPVNDEMVAIKGSPARSDLATKITHFRASRQADFWAY